MSYKHCKHIKENGTYCQSPTLRGRDYCYFHLVQRVRRLSMARAHSQGATWRLQLPPLEDMHSVQSALMQVLDALAAGQLDNKRAGLLLYGLQQAATNIKSVTGWLGRSRYQIEDEDDARVESCAGLEAQFALPKGLNIDTPPEVAFPPPVEVEDEADAGLEAEPEVVARSRSTRPMKRPPERVRALAEGSHDRQTPLRRSS